MLDITTSVIKAINTFNSSSSYNSGLENAKKAAGEVTNLFRNTHLTIIVQTGIPFIPENVYKLLPTDVKNDIFIARDIVKAQRKIRKEAARPTANQILTGIVLAMIKTINHQESDKYNAMSTTEQADYRKVKGAQKREATRIKFGNVSTYKPFAQLQLNA